MFGNINGIISLDRSMRWNDFRTDIMSSLLTRNEGGTLTRNEGGTCNSNNNNNNNNDNNVFILRG